MKANLETRIHLLEEELALLVAIMHSFDGVVEKAIAPCASSVGFTRSEEIFWSSRSDSKDWRILSTSEEAREDPNR